METQICNSIKDSLLSYFGQQVEVDTIGDRCAISLPLMSIDDRYLTIFIEPKMSGFYSVSDGGKTAAELFSQGIHITDKKSDIFRALAHRMGIGFGDEMFSITCKTDALHSSILAVAQCASLAMYELLQHKPIIEEESITSRVGATIEKWRPDYVTNVYSEMEVAGRKASHRFNFVSMSLTPHWPVGVNILSPSGNSKAQAERYGFLALDLETTTYADWRRLAIVIKSDQWGKNAIQLVKDVSNEFLALRTGEEKLIDEAVPVMMSRLAS